MLIGSVYMMIWKLLKPACGQQYFSLKAILISSCSRPDSTLNPGQVPLSKQASCFELIPEFHIVKRTGFQPVRPLNARFPFLEFRAEKPVVTLQQDRCGRTSLPRKPAPAAAMHLLFPCPHYRKTLRPQIG